MEDLLDDEPGESTAPSVPIGVKKLRACLVSRLVKTENQWLDEGCENVPELPIRGDRDAMLQSTTPHFDGQAARAPRREARRRPRGARGAALTRARAPLARPRRLVALMDPQKSWVGRWQGIGARACGPTRRARRAPRSRAP